jgi:hypothetical protein
LEPGDNVGPTADLDIDDRHQEYDGRLDPPLYSTSLPSGTNTPTTENHPVSTKHATQSMPGPHHLPVPTPEATPTLTNGLHHLPVPPPECTPPYYDHTFQTLPHPPVPTSPHRPSPKTTHATLNIATLNIQGGGSNDTKDKWTHLNQIVRDQNHSILAIQETHLNDDNINNLHTTFGKRLHILHS